MKQREIKFRLWDSENKIMVLSEDSILGEGASFDIGSDGSTHCTYNRSFYPNIKDKTELAHANSSRCILMQFTGLHDKNGKEVYEGDIVKTVDRQEKEARVIEWKVECGDDYEFTGFSISDFNIKYDEVIGNIYENPNLIKK